jgi:hypothetical protein
VCPEDIGASLIGRKFLFCFGEEEYGWLFSTVVAFNEEEDHDFPGAPFGVQFDDVEHECWVDLPRAQYGATRLELGRTFSC